MLNILARLCSVGLAKGEVSANDLSDVHYSNPHVVGACFKLMKRIGFCKTDHIVASTRKKSHDSFVLVWTLIDHTKARAFLQECQKLIAVQAAKEETQQELNL